MKKGMTILNKLRILCGCISSLFIINSTVLSSGTSELLWYAEQLLQAGEYDSAVTEFKRFAYFNPGHDELYLALWGTGRCYREMGEWNKSIEALQSALFLAPDDSISAAISLEIAETFFRAERWDNGILELDRMIIGSPPKVLERKAHFFKFLVHLRRFNWQDALRAYRSYVASLKDLQEKPLHVKLDSLLVQAQTLPLRSETLATWLSTFVPGLGQIYAGDLRNGVNALGLNAILGFWVYEAFSQKAFFDGTMLFSSAFLRYYLGNRYRAAEIARKANAERQSEMAEKIMRIAIEALPE